MTPTTRKRTMPRTDPAPRPAPADVSAKLSSVRETLNAIAIERDREIEALLVCLVAGEHPLFVGNPGLAKSFVGDKLFEAFDGDIRKFSTMVMKTSTLSEIFGPDDMASLLSTTRTSIRRLTEGYLPDAHFAILDELWEGSPAVLKGMLRILNERTINQGRDVVKCPLVMAVAMSNRWPTDPDNAASLAAIFDRFLVRLNVRPIRSRENVCKLAFEKTKRKADFKVRLTLDDVEVAREEVEALSDVHSRWTSEAVEAWQHIRFGLPYEGVPLDSDRRTEKTVKVASALAFVNGHDKVEASDLTILRHVLWTDPNEQPGVVEKFVMEVADPSSFAVETYYSQAESILSDMEKGMHANRRDDAKRKKVVEGAYAQMKELADRAKTALSSSPKADAALAYFERKRDDLLVTGAAAFIKPSDIL
jgi:MoxR-like ATPase